MEDRAPLPDRLRALATVFQERAWADCDPPNSGFLSDHAASLAELAQQVEAEYARVQAIDGLKTGEMMGGDGPVPRMFSIEDPDGNHIWVVQSA